MIRVVLVVVVWVLGSVPVLAQSSVLDFSKPMTGKSRFGINLDGSPLEMGAPARRESSPGPVVACDGGPCGSGERTTSSAPPPADDQFATDGQSGNDNQPERPQQSEQSQQSEQTGSPASQGEAGDAVQR
jgi:hypothetical protein